jgi:HK97 family phage major capsid protein
MIAEELRRIHDDYRHAIEAARDGKLPEEARDKASADVIDLRHKLDAALIEDKADREDDNLAAAIEAREASARIAATVKKATEPRTSFPGLVDYIEKRVQHASFNVPLETRATYDLTTSESSYMYGSRLIPQTWAEQVWLFEIAQSGVLQAGPTIINSTNANPISTPTLTTDMTAAARTEGSANTNSTYPVIGTVPLNGYPISGWVSISDEMLRDSGPDLESLLGRLAGRALGAGMAAYLGDIDSGSGESAPAAITVGVTSAATCASATAVTVDELITLYAGVLPAYRVNGKFIANSAVTLSTMLAKNGEGTYLWAPAVAAGAPDTFLGKPWFEDAYFDASAASNIPVVFGDVAAAYVVRLVGGVQVDFSRDYQFPSFETSMRFQQVFDAATMDTLAVKGLTLAAS